MGFRIGLLGAATACLAIVLALASGPIGSANAAATDLSYNEVTRFVYGASPEPGSYQSGSFDSDFAAATQKQSHGLLAMVKNAENMLKSGSGATYYYLDNMERNDDLRDGTGTITMPDKHQITHLDFGKKTYWFETPNPQRTEAPATMAPPQPQQSQAPPQPGTAKITVTIATTSLGPKNLGGVDTNGYQLSFKMVTTDATGSCKNGTFGTTITEFVSSYPEPTLKYPQETHMMPRPNTASPLEGAETMAMNPGCTPKVTARLHTGPTAPSGRLVLWEQLMISAGQTAGGPQAGAGTIIERGDVKPLGPGDAGLFAPPAGFTQVQPPSS